MLFGLECVHNVAGEHVTRVSGRKFESELIVIMRVTLGLMDPCSSFLIYNMSITLHVMTLEQILQYIKH